MTYRNVGRLLQCHTGMLGGCYNDIQECWEVGTMTYRNVGRLIQ